MSQGYISRNRNHGHQKFKSEKLPGISFLISQLHVAIQYCTNFLYILFLMYQAWRSGNGCKRKTGRNLLTILFGNKDLIYIFFNLFTARSFWRLANNVGCTEHKQPERLATGVILSGRLECSVLRFLHTMFLVYILKRYPLGGVFWEERRFRYHEVLNHFKVKGNIYVCGPKGKHI